MRSLRSGVGKDWGIGRLALNSNTKKLPGVAQGGFYKLGTVPTSTSSVRTLNQVQKTHVGPLYSLASTVLRYRTDTTGGNSGSPVIREKSGFPIGIHTHGGCRSNNSGSNSGTRIDRSDLQAQLKLFGVGGGGGPQPKPGSVTYFGTACAGSAGTPGLFVSGTIQIKNSISVPVINLRNSSTGWLVIGASKTAQGMVKLPLNLQGIGMAGCFQYVSSDVILQANATSFGYALVNLTIPNNTKLIDVEVHLQHWSSDKTVNTAGLVTSNGATIKIGG